MALDGADGHAEGFAAPGDLAADATEAHHAQGLALQGGEGLVDRIIPASLSLRLDHLVQPAGKDQHLSQHVLGASHAVDTTRIRQDDATPPHDVGYVALHPGGRQLDPAHALRRGNEVQGEIAKGDLDTGEAIR